MLDRRSFIGALGASLGAHRGTPARAGATQVFVSACMTAGADGEASVAAFSLDGELVFQTRLPARGHDAVARPGSGDIVVFARRPGNWAAVVERATGQVRLVVTTPAERHFFGHGAFSPDGRLLYATENVLGSGEGTLGIYDAEAGYQRVGERPTHGPGPHDLAFLPGREHMVVANGGTRTHPGTGREILNPDAMEPSLVLLDVASGQAIHKVELGAEMKGLSIRHLAAAGDRETVFACQWEGDPTQGPQLVGTLSKTGTVRWLEMPDDDLARLGNYVGSVALDASERIVAATSPRGGTVAFWDRASGRYLGLRRMPDVCGVAAASDGGRAGVFVVSSGNAGVRLAAADQADLTRLASKRLASQSWDNHILAL